ncbi:UDP-sugar hydrolase [Klebsiella aerogenes]|nr:UDP-sugar hydrolase [Klebsiella aerogenes]
MGHLLLAAQMARSNADFAVMSGGGIRDSIEAGDITYKDVMKVQPFGNVLTYVDMSGKEVVDYLTAVAQMKPDSGALSAVCQRQLCSQRWQTERSENQRRTGGSGEDLPDGDAEL